MKTEDDEGQRLMVDGARQDKDRIFNWTCTIFLTSFNDNLTYRSSTTARHDVESELSVI